MIFLLACAPRTLPPPPAPFRFAVVGDRTDEPDDVGWRDILAQVQAREPDLVLTVGDLVDDPLDPVDWALALSATATLSAPVAYTPGNHDIIDEATASVFAERTGQAPWRSFDQGGVHFVIVDNSVAERWEELPPDQQAWLLSDLSAHQDDVVVVAMHKPFWALRAARGQQDPLHAAFVDAGVDAVFTGHWHQHLFQEIDGIPYVGVGSSGGVVAGLPDPLLGNAYEYAWVEVIDGALSIRTVAGGRDLPVDHLTRADADRLRAWRLGAARATIRGDQLHLHVENRSDAPMAGAVEIEANGWTLEALAVPYDLAPRQALDTTLAATPPAELFPTPRLRMQAPLPDAGLRTFAWPSELARTVEVPRGSAVLDGDLSEWAGAPSIGPFTTARGLPATTEPTQAWLRHDDQALWFAARCQDSRPDELRRNHHGRDGQVVFDDRVGLVLLPRPDLLAWFYVTPNGAVWDLRKAGGVLERGWDGVEAAAQVDAEGWTVEVRVPYAALGLDIVPETWSFDLRRRQVRTQGEATATSAFGSRDPDRIATLRLLP